MLKISVLCITIAYAVHGGGALLQDEIPSSAKIAPIRSATPHEDHSDTASLPRVAMMESSRVISAVGLESDHEALASEGLSAQALHTAQKAPTPPVSTHEFGGKEIGLIAGGAAIFSLAVWVYYSRMGSGVGFDQKKGSGVRHSTLHMLAGDLSCVVEETSSYGEQSTQDSKESLIADGEEPKMSTMAASMSLVTVMIGAGVLAMPHVASLCGWYVAGPLIAGAGLVNLNCCHTLVDCIERASKRRSITQYKDIAHVAFGPACAALTDLVFLLFLAACIAVYIVLIADNLNFLVPWAKRPWILATGACVLGTALIKDVSVLGKLAFIGVVASIVYAVSIIGAGVLASETYTKTQHNDYPSTSVSALIGKFSVVMFGFCCCDCLTSFRANMEKPQEITTAINRAHVATASVYVAVGYVGFWGWGNQVKGNVLDSMCHAPGCVGSGEPPLSASQSGEKMMLGYMLAIAVVANLVVSLPFSAFVLFKAIEEKFQTFRTNSCSSLTMRMTVVLVLTFAGICIPFFMEMLDLVSAVLIVAICMLFPTSFAMKLDYDDGNTFNRKTPIHMTTFGFGVVAMYLGVVEALASLEKAQAANPNAMNPFKDFFGQAGTI